MSGPKASTWTVASPEELQRREDERRERRCSNLSSQLRELNGKLLPDLRVGMSEPAQKTHESLIEWEESLTKALEEAREALREQRTIEQEQRLLEERIRCMSAELSNAGQFELRKPAIASLHDLQAWGETLLTMMEKVEITADFENERREFHQRQKKNVGTRLGLAEVKLKRNEGQPRIDEACALRRREKLRRIAESISEVEDDQVRERLSLEAAPLLEGDDGEFEESLIQLNTRVRSIKKAQRRKAVALEEAAKVDHLDSDEARAVRDAAEDVDSPEGLADIKRRVEALLEAERRELDERYVRKAIREALTELGYSYGEGFMQTEYGPVAYAEKGPESDYALRIQVSTHGQDMFTRVVSRGETTPEQDKEAEESLCAVYHDMMRGLNERGIETALVREAKPGEHPLDKIGQAGGWQAASGHRRRRSGAVSRGRHAS